MRSSDWSSDVCSSDLFDTLVGRLKEYVGYTPIHNIAGAPSMSVPLAWTEAGLPVGSMFSARRGAERTLLELAYQLEARSEERRGGNAGVRQVRSRLADDH